MNESKSSRYHRLQRRTSAAATVLAAAPLAALALTGGSVVLRDVTGGSAAACASLIFAACSAVALPAAWYRSCFLDRRFELSRVSTRRWLFEYTRSGAIVLAGAAAAAEALYAAIRALPDWWWLAAAAGATACTAALTAAAPAVILPLLSEIRPLERRALRERLVRLSRRAGVEVIDVREWVVGGDSRRAAAALAGVGGTRRILVSDTLLAGYSEDEIEVVLAHEIAHHVHRDVGTRLLLESGVLAAGFGAAAAVLGPLGPALRLSGPADVAGLPLIAGVVGLVWLAATPVFNALSRGQERRADAMAVRIASSPEAFASALRRMAAQNLAEERPSRATLWFFHTHPPVEERLAAVQAAISAAGSRVPARPAGASAGPASASGSASASPAEHAGV